MTTNIFIIYRLIYNDNKYFYNDNKYFYYTSPRITEIHLYV